MNRVLSVDIGSTWTKAALFDVGSKTPAALRRAAVPTTQDDLFEGVAQVARELLALPTDAPLAPALDAAPLYACSSAKGGLSIAAIGIVPDLTARVARLAAASAGGRIAAHHSYRLGAREVAALEVEQPDIVLFCGGTDGGNESYVRANARALAGSALASTILYAGNASMRDEVSGILRGKRLVVVANAMPEVGALDIEPAREAIREIYLGSIVEGRGLGRVRELCAADIRPTPLAVFDLVGMLASAGREWSDTLVIDMGGATTDIYSHTAAFHGVEGWVLRGIREPALTRTVEGDLGLRVSARSAVQTGGGYIRQKIEGEPAAVQAWAERAARQTDILPTSPQERSFDELIAEACLYHAFLRHAGTVEEAYTASGKVRVQKGKDLRGVRRIVASGGFLARRGMRGSTGSASPVLRALESARTHVDERTGATSLLPEAPEVLTDRQYLFPLLGNIADSYPQQAAEIAAACLANAHLALPPDSTEGHDHA
jgi:uncharacterized protein (TIGR01319 family)